MSNNSAVAELARRLHEGLAQAVLNELQAGPLEKVEWEDRNRPSRLAPAINVLRKKEGYSIDGSGTPSDPYILTHPSPIEIPVSREMKDGYYESGHWRGIRGERLELDDHRCAQCKTTTRILQVHHWVYNLFAEDLSELMTFCETCHKALHDFAGVRLLFPQVVHPAIARRLGWRPRVHSLFPME